MVDSGLTKTIAKVRPKFKLVSPLVSKIMLVFGFGNLLLGLSLFTYKVQLPHFQAINFVTTYQVWGAIFFALGVSMLTTYKLNAWSAMRKTLFVGIMLKTFWLVALTIRFLTGDQPNPIVLIVWLVITSLQFVAYTDFIPSPKQGAKDERIS